MARIPLEVVARPVAPTTLIVQRDPDTVIFADSMGDDDYLCGECDNLLMTGVRRGKVLNLVIQCARCDAFNATE